MFDFGALLVIFAFGLVITGVVYLGVVQAREQARVRIRARNSSGKQEA